MKTYQPRLANNGAGAVFPPFVNQTFFNDPNPNNTVLLIPAELHGTDYASLNLSGINVQVNSASLLTKQIMLRFGEIIGDESNR